MERDPFDIFLERCAKEVDLSSEYGKSGSKEIPDELCPICLSQVPKGSRHCPECGALCAIPEDVSGTFKQKTITRQHLAVTLLGIESGVEIEGRMYIRTYLKIANHSLKRVHISLTYVDSVLIDMTGRQFSPVEADEFQEDPREPVFPTWFHIYPEAYREGVLLFREGPVPVKRVVVCAMHQENEDELFVFDLNIPPSVRD